MRAFKLAVYLKLHWLHCFSSHHLSRHTRTVAATTGLTENVYNVSAPGVGWSRRFGGSNISTELNNRQINDYIISTGINYTMLVSSLLNLLLLS